MEALRRVREWRRICRARSRSIPSSSSTRYSPRVSRLVLLDNFPVWQTQIAVQRRATARAHDAGVLGRAVARQRRRLRRGPGVDYLAVGALTHSVRCARPGSGTCSRMRVSPGLALAVALLSTGLSGGRAGPHAGSRSRLHRRAALRGDCAGVHGVSPRSARAWRPTQRDRADESAARWRRGQRPVALSDGGLYLLARLRPGQPGRSRPTRSGRSPTPCSTSVRLPPRVRRTPIRSRPSGWRRPRRPAPAVGNRCRMTVRRHRPRRSSDSTHGCGGEQAGENPVEQGLLPGGTQPGQRRTARRCRRPITHQVDDDHREPDRDVLRNQCALGTTNCGITARKNSSPFGLVALTRNPRTTSAPRPPATTWSIWDARVDPTLRHCRNAR